MNIRDKIALLALAVFMAFAMAMVFRAMGSA